MLERENHLKTTTQAWSVSVLAKLPNKVEKREKI
jgi:hypothetical protein